MRSRAPVSFHHTKKIMRNLLAIAFFGLVVALSACKQDSKGITTAHGHRFINHTKLDGAKAQSGEVATINVFTWINDSLVGSTLRDMGGPREVMLPDSSQLKGRVPAVYDALFLMTKGDSATLIQTVDSLMARGIPKSFGEVKELRYEIVMVDLLNKEAVAKKQEEEAQKAEVAKAKGVEVSAMLQSTLAEYKGKKLGAKLQKTASGLEYVVLDKGAGAAIKNGEPVQTNYYGVFLKDGQMFDNSYERGGAVQFKVGELVPGFNEGMLLLNHGGKAIFFIPYNLAYGEQGGNGMPPKADLVFYMELE